MPSFLWFSRLIHTAAFYHLPFLLLVCLFLLPLLLLEGGVEGLWCTSSPRLWMHPLQWTVAPVLSSSIPLCSFFLPVTTMHRQTLGRFHGEHLCWLLCRYTFLFLLGWYLGVGLLDCAVSRCSLFEDRRAVFFKRLRYSAFLSAVHESQFLHTLANKCFIVRPQPCMWGDSSLFGVFISLLASDVEHLLIKHYKSCLEKCLLRFFANYLIWLSLLLLSCGKSVYILGTGSFLDIFVDNLSSLLCQTQSLGWKDGSAIQG